MTTSAREAVVCKCYVRISYTLWPKFSSIKKRRAQQTSTAACAEHKRPMTTTSKLIPTGPFSMQLTRGLSGQDAKHKAAERHGVVTGLQSVGPG